MGCANNFMIKDKKTSQIYKIPCRYCINCREDRRREWEARANYEFKKHISGTFLTLTYDDFYLSELLRTGNDELTRASLNYEDPRKFLRNIKNEIKKEPKKQNILRQENFSYIGIGEYGENGKIWDRPHWHILIFGLDFKYNQKLYEEKWDKGLIDSKPILKGGINYVLKYMDKQIMGKKGKWENYKRYNVEPPRQFQSLGFGSGLYIENMENMENGAIKDGQKKIYVPQYYKNKLGIKTDERKTTEEKIENLKNYNKKIENPYKKMNEREYLYIKGEIENEQLKINKIRERNSLARAEKNGEKIYIRKD